MLLLGQREINQHTSAMKWHNARIIHLSITVYPLRRLENLTHHCHSKSTIYSSKYCF